MMPAICCIGRFTAADCSACGDIFMVPTTENGANDLHALRAMLDAHYASSEPCRTLFKGLPTLDDVAAVWQVSGPPDDGRDSVEMVRDLRDEW